MMRQGQCNGQRGQGGAAQQAGTFEHLVSSGVQATMVRPAGTRVAWGVPCQQGDTGTLKVLWPHGRSLPLAFTVACTGNGRH
jgi:hypothetical protein